MALKKILLIILIFSSCLLCLLFYRNKYVSQEHFKKYILDPIPKSVKNIKVDQTIYIYGYAYLFEFDINKEDMNLIIDSKSLIKSIYKGYSSPLGSFCIGYKNYYSYYIQVYGRSKPVRWFQPESWDNPDCYCYITSVNHQNDYQILLFNKDKNKAYFYIERSK